MIVLDIGGKYACDFHERNSLAAVHPNRRQYLTEAIADALPEISLPKTRERSDEQVYATDLHSDEAGYTDLGG